MPPEKGTLIHGTQARAELPLASAHDRIVPLHVMSPLIAHAFERGGMRARFSLSWSSRETSPRTPDGASAILRRGRLTCGPGTRTARSSPSNTLSGSRSRPLELSGSA